MSASRAVTPKVLENECDLFSNLTDLDSLHRFPKETNNLFSNISTQFCLSSANGHVNNSQLVRYAVIWVYHQFLNKQLTKQKHPLGNSCSSLMRFLWEIFIFINLMIQR
jgi:hypothetical protein